MSRENGESEKKYEEIHSVCIISDKKVLSCNINNAKSLEVIISVEKVINKMERMINMDYER